MALGQARDEQAASPTPAAHTCGRGVPAAKFAQVLHALERIEARLDKLEAKMPTPPPTSFVFTAPTTQSPRGSNLFPGLAASGTTQVDKSKQIPYVNLREKVALQNIALEKLQAKVDAQEQGEKDKMERLMKDVIIVNNKQTNHLKTLMKEQQAKMDSREQAQNEKIANLGAEVAHQKTVLQGLAGKVLSIQHGMCAHFQRVLDDLATKVFNIEFYKIEPLTSRGGGTTRMKYQDLFLDTACKVPNSDMMAIGYAGRVDTKMQEGPCTAVTRSECTHGPACQGGSFAHLT